VDSISLPTTAEHCSQSLQVIDMSSCAVSEVVSLTTLAEVGYADGFADGVASVECDLDEAYDDGFTDGEASVVVPDGEDYCDADSTDWDALAGACVSSIEEPKSCFQSGFCYLGDVVLESGLPNSIVGPASWDDCNLSGDWADIAAWGNGELAAEAINSFFEFSLIVDDLCE
jgi:hypothetical protein